MKYFIVEVDNELTLFKVANDLIKSFEKKHLAKVIADGNSIIEALLNFQQSIGDASKKPRDAKSYKYKEGI